MKKKGRETARAAVTVATTGIAAIADASSGGTGIVSGVAAGAALLFDAFWTRQQARGARMLRAAFDVPDDQFADVMRKKLDNEHVRNALLETMRAALEALADDVMPALGGLVREYERANRRPDAFFRGCCRVLQDLSSEEYASLVGLVKCIAKSRLGDESTASAATTRGDEEWATAAEGAPPLGQAFVLVQSSAALDHPARSFAATGCDPAHLSRLFHLFDRENLAEWRTDGRGGRDDYFWIKVGVARRIARSLP